MKIWQLPIIFWEQMYTKAEHTCRQENHAQVLGNAHFTLVASQDQVFPNHNVLILAWHPSGNVIVMGDAPMPARKKRSIITNRQLNFTLSPVDLHNKKEMPYKLPEYEIDGTWNQHQSIILDILLDRIFRGFHGNPKKLPKSWRKKKTLSVVSKFMQGHITPAVVAFMSRSEKEAYIHQAGWDVMGGIKREYDDLQTQQGIDMDYDEFVDRDFVGNREFSDFVDRMKQHCKIFYDDFKIELDALEMLDFYECLLPYRYSYKKYLRKIAETKFRMNHKIKYVQVAPTFDDSGKRTSYGQLIDIFYNMQAFENLFDVDFDKHRILLNLKKPLGKCVIHNTLLLDTDWCPHEAYSLSKNAFFLYKRFIINKRAGKYKKDTITLGFEEVKRFLDLKATDDRHVNAIVEKALDDLQDKGLVGSFEYKRTVGKKRYYELKF